MRKLNAVGALAVAVLAPMGLRQCADTGPDCHAVATFDGYGNEYTMSQCTGMFGWQQRAFQFCTDGIVRVGPWVGTDGTASYSTGCQRGTVTSRGSDEVRI